MEELEDVSLSELDDWSSDRLEDVALGSSWDEARLWLGLVES